jgi:hypothetical protein
VIVDTTSAKGLETGQILDTGCVRAGVEVAGDDGRKGSSMTSVEVRERDDLSFARRLGFKAPRRRGPDEEQIILAGERNRDSQCAPGYVQRVGQAKVESFHDAVRPRVATALPP